MVKDVGWEVVDWIRVVQDWDRWRGFLDTKLKLWIP